MNDVEATARAYVAALNAHDPDATAQLVTEDFVNEHTSALGVSCAGREEYRSRLPGFFAQMPGLRYEIDEVLIERDRAVVAYVLTARPEGHCVRVQGVFRLVIDGDLVARRVDYWDGLDYLRQVRDADDGVLGVDHVQLTMPSGGEPHARRFYHDLLGLAEVPRPTRLSERQGCWFERGDARLHLGVDGPSAEFHPTQPAHPALVVGDLGALVDRLRGAGVAVVTAEDPTRVYVDDPFANRLELVQAG